MLTRQQFLNQVRQEAKICRHLWSKIPPGESDRSLGPKMRTTLELLRYLASCARVSTWALLEDGWSKLRDQVDENAALPFEGFPAAMDAQVAKVESLSAAVSDADLQTRLVKLPWGATMPLGEALVSTALRFLTAYRMQLFLHLKAHGQTALNTRDCWLGEDPAA